jgi:hypothetical protein
LHNYERWFGMLVMQNHIIDLDRLVKSLLPSFIII